MNEGRNDGKKKSNYFDSKKKEKDPDAMDIDRLSPRKTFFLDEERGLFQMRENWPLGKRP